jgi:hypothetical protein
VLKIGYRIMDDTGSNDIVVGDFNFWF